MKLIKIITLSIFSISLFAFNANARDTIKIVGSSTVYPYATVVAERFGKTGFNTPIIESTGTGGGMKLFCAGVGTNHPDITNASRKIKSNEIALCAKNGVTDIIEITIGNDGLTLAHSLDAADADFTQEQLYLALAAKVPANIIITDGNVIAGELIDNPYINWSDIDPSLPNHKIEILIAPPTSGTRDAWNSLIMSKGCKKSGAYKQG
jgi:phosphate transport system substrate-binding protein